MNIGSSTMANRRRVTCDSNSEEVSKLHSLAQLAGVNISTSTHSAIVELLRSGVPPTTIYSLLRLLAAKSAAQSKASDSTKESSAVASS